MTGGVSEIATGCGLCTTVAGSLEGLPLIIFGTNMAFEGIQDLWYTLRGELDHESKNLIKEATGHKVDNLVELAEIGMSIYSGKVASKKITGKLGEESEKLSGLLKKTRKPVSLVSRTKRLVKKFMPKKRYRKFKVVDVEELAKKQCLKPNIQLFAEGKKIVGTKFNEIKPTQSVINRERVDFYKSKLKLGEKVQPIEVCEVEGKGTFIIEGHHRFVASKETGIPVDIIRKKSGGPIGFPSWEFVEWKKYIDEKQFWGE